MSSVFI